MRSYEDILAISIKIAKRLRELLGDELYTFVINVLSEKAKRVSPSKMFRLADTFVIVASFERNIDIASKVSEFEVKLGIQKLGRWLSVVYRDYRGRYNSFVEKLKYVATW